MNKTDLIKKIEEIQKLIPQKGASEYDWQVFSFTAKQFICTYIGKNTEFYKVLIDDQRVWLTEGVLKSIKVFLELDLDIEKTELYNTQIDVINDFLIQANRLCEDENFHPAAAAILIGASLEEFLRKLAEKNNIFPEKQNIDSFAKELKAKNLIDTQDMKDITAWAGFRNLATHGKFDQVDDRKRVRNVLEGVNLFMRKKML